MAHDIQIHVYHKSFFTYNHGLLTLFQFFEPQIRSGQHTFISLNICLETIHVFKNCPCPVIQIHM